MKGSVFILILILFSTEKFACIYSKNKTWLSEKYIKLQFTSWSKGWNIIISRSLWMTILRIFDYFLCEKNID